MLKSSCVSYYLTLKVMTSYVKAAFSGLLCNLQRTGKLSWCVCLFLKFKCLEKLLEHATLEIVLTIVSF